MLWRSIHERIAFDKALCMLAASPCKSVLDGQLISNSNNRLDTYFAWSRLL